MEELDRLEVIRLKNEEKLKEEKKEVKPVKKKKSKKQKANIVIEEKENIPEFDHSEDCNYTVHSKGAN